MNPRAADNSNVSVLFSMIFEQGEEIEVSLLTDSLLGAVDISVCSSGSLTGLESLSDEVLRFQLQELPV